MDFIFRHNLFARSIDDMNDDYDVRVGVIGHGWLLRAFSFARPIRGSGHV